MEQFPDNSTDNIQSSGNNGNNGAMDNWIVEYCEAKIVNRLREIQNDLRGHIYLVCFDVLIKHLGPKWEIKKNVIWQHIQSHFEREFHYPDWCMPVKDNSWLFVFPSLTPAKACAKCEEIFSETVHFFVGELQYSDLPIFEVNVEVASKLTMRQCNFKESDDEIKHIAPVASNHKFASVSITESIRVDTALEPTFRVKESTLIGHRFSPNIVDIKSDFVLSSQKIALLDPKIIEDIQIANIEQGIALLYDLPANNRHIVMVVPATFHTMTSARARGKIISEITSAAAELDLKIIFELRELSNVPSHRVTEIVTFLKPFCKAVIGNIGTDMKSVISAKGCGLDGVVLEYDRVERSTEEFNNYLKSVEAAAKLNSGIFLINGLENIQQIEAISNIAGISHACMINVKP